MQGMVKRGEKEQNAPLASSPDSIPFVVPENKNKNNEDTKHNRFPFWELTPVVAGHADCNSFNCLMVHSLIHTIQVR